MTSTPAPDAKHGLIPSRLLSMVALAACLLLLTSCKQTGIMKVQPYNRPLSQSDFFIDGRSARNFPAGTVPQIDERVDDPALTGLDENGNFITNFPVLVDNQLIQRGQERYGIYCEVCHGIDGHGDGKVTSFGFSKPPDLLTEDIKETANGDIFNSITNGFGKMLSYGYRVKAPDRWAVIAYLRAMQLKGGHLTQELTPAELQQLGE